VPGGPPGEEAAAAEPETEVFYTFVWAPKRRGGDRTHRRREDGEGKPRGRKPQGKPKGQRGKPQTEKPKTYSAKPRKEDKVDPDNPFAVLASLKDRS
jgi:ATP-dependent RNA helicase SUPV3L1/SUV3